MHAGMFLISVMGLHARSITVPNILIGVLVFFGGVCQFLAGIMEFMTGNTVRLPSPWRVPFARSS